MTIKWSVMIGLLAVATWTIPVRADEPTTAGACRADEQKFCGTVQPGGGRIIECMKQHQSDLSDACKQNIAAHKEQMKEKRQDAKAACQADEQKFCADVKPGQGRKIICLKQHQSDLSSGCQTALAGMKMQGSAPQPSTNGGNAPTPDSNTHNN